MAVHDDMAEPPLDPAQERLRRKLVRLLLVSGGIMMLGLIAVFSAIVYKVSEAGERAPALSSANPVEAAIPMPPGARVLATALDGDRALVTIEAPDGATFLLLIDLPTGAVLGRYAPVPG